jgi:hypothetical protein
VTSLTYRGGAVAGVSYAAPSGADQQVAGA